MERDNIEGAEAAAEYFIELHQYGYATGDLNAWLKMSHPECQFCSGASEHISELYDSGGYATGGEFIVHNVTALEPDSEYSHYRVGISGVERPSREYAENDAEVFVTTGGNVNYVVAVLPSDGDDWAIRGVAVEND